MSKPDIRRAWLRQVGEHIEVLLRVIPGSKRSEIAGERAGRLLVRVTAPPEAGRANAAAISLLAQYLGVPKTSCVITCGAAQRDKTVLITGIDASMLVVDG